MCSLVSLRCEVLFNKNKAVFLNNVAQRLLRQQGLVPPTDKFCTFMCNLDTIMYFLKTNNLWYRFFILQGFSYARLLSAFMSSEPLFSVTVFSIVYTVLWCVPAPFFPVSSNSNETYLKINLKMKWDASLFVGRYLRQIWAAIFWFLSWWNCNYVWAPNVSAWCGVFV